jgi:hypothetical protein
VKSPKKLAQTIEQRVETNFEEVKLLFNSLRDLLEENVKLMKDEEVKNESVVVSSRRNAHRSEVNKMTTSFINTSNFNRNNFTSNSNNVIVLLTI